MHWRQCIVSIWGLACRHTEVQSTACAACRAWSSATAAPDTARGCWWPSAPMWQLLPSFAALPIGLLLLQSSMKWSTTTAAYSCTLCLLRLLIGLQCCLLR
jgi:hypothetical protein